MSLTSTLAKVAVGVMVAKGVQHVMKGGAKNESAGGGLGGVLGQLAGGSGGGSGLGNILGQLSGQSRAQAQPSGGLGGLLSGLAGGGSQQSSGGGLGSLLGGAGSSALGGMLGNMLGGKSSGAGGGLGGLLGSLSQNSNSSMGFGSMLNQAVDGFGKADVKPSTEDEQVSAVLLKAMLQAAKCDGKIDEQEKSAIMEQLDDATEQDIAFIREQFKAPVDPQGLARSVPKGMEQQAYAMALLAIDLDNRNEANYLDSFAKALSLSPTIVNGIHDKMNEPKLYN